MLEATSFENLQLSERVRTCQLIGEGPYSWVYQGELLSLGRVIGSCVVKMVRPRDNVDGVELLSRVRTPRLTHPDLLAVQNYSLLTEGVAKGWLYAVMDVADKTLNEDYQARVRQHAQVVDSWLDPVSRALAYLHSQEICHGRIRPTNVIFCQGGWKLTGYEFHSVRDQLLLHKESPSEWVFRAPESFEGVAGLKTSDMWSLGVMIHTFLTGKLPSGDLQGLSRGDQVRRMMNSSPVLERMQSPYDRLVKECLIKDTGHRLTIKQFLTLYSGGELEEEYLDAGGGEASFSRSRLKESFQHHREQKDLKRHQQQLEEAKRSQQELLEHRVERKTPLYATKTFFGLLLIAFCAAFAGGWWLAPKPTEKLSNKVPGELSLKEIRFYQLDSKGRMLKPSTFSVDYFYEKLSKDLSLEMVEIPAGSFYMGGGDQEPGMNPNERPRHLMTVERYWIGAYEITNEQWNVVAEMPQVKRELPLKRYHPEEKLHPARGVSWGEAVEFCERLTRHTGRYYRLPTEVEWEYAARAQTQTPFCYGATLSSEVANFDGSSGYDQGPPSLFRANVISVGALEKPNRFGLHDVHGNVEEWCLNSLYDYKDQQGAWLGYAPPIGRGSHVVRGGGWYSQAVQSRSSFRRFLSDGDKLDSVGFRVMMPADYEIVL